MDCVSIERIRNGYTVAMDDPSIVAANRKRDTLIGGKSVPSTPWRDPRVEYAFKDVKEVMTFLEKNLDSALPMDEFSSSFDTAVAEGSD